MSTSISKSKNRRDFSNSVASSVGIAAEPERVKEAEPEKKYPVSAPREVAPSPFETFSQIPESGNLDQILAMTGKNKRGQQKSVYFDNEVYQFIQEKSQKNGVPFSFVMNLMLKDYIKKMS